MIFYGNYIFFSLVIFIFFCEYFDIFYNKYIFFIIFKEIRFREFKTGES